MSGTTKPSWQHDGCANTRRVGQARFSERRPTIVEGREKDRSSDGANDCGAAVLHFSPSLCPSAAPSLSLDRREPRLACPTLCAKADPIRLVRIGEQDGDLESVRGEDKGPIQLVWMVNKAAVGYSLAWNLLHHPGKLDGVVDGSRLAALAHHLLHHRDKLDGAAHRWLVFPADRARDLTLPGTGNHRGNDALSGPRFANRRLTQGSAALHPGLSNDARSGLRTAANGRISNNRAPTDPEGVTFDSPGRSATEPWVIRPQLNQKPQRGATPRRPDVAARYHLMEHWPTDDARDLMLAGIDNHRGNHALSGRVSRSGSGLSLPKEERVKR
jgi:hypothetical protein